MEFRVVNPYVEALNNLSPDEHEKMINDTNKILDNLNEMRDNGQLDVPSRIPVFEDISAEETVFPKRQLFGLRR